MFYFVLAGRGKPPLIDGKAQSKHYGSDYSFQMKNEIEKKRRKMKTNTRHAGNKAFMTKICVFMQGKG